MPTWDQFMVQILAVLSDGETRRLRDLYGLVADHVGLTAQRAEGDDLVWDAAAP